MRPVLRLLLLPFGLLGLGLLALLGLSLANQHRGLALWLLGSDVVADLSAHGMGATLRLATMSPLGAAEHYRRLTLRLRDGREASFDLPDNWGGIAQLSLYATGGRIRVLDCVTGFDVDAATGASLPLPEGYEGEAALHLVSFVRQRGLTVATPVERIPVAGISAAC